MSLDPNARRLLPHNSQMQSFSFAPTNLGPRENQKNYVFVDEHNRHKRLKVMRACEGCRRRKIKCDAATTNTWPCSACIRLKLRCIPPTVNYDQDFPGSSQGFDGERAVEFDDGNGIDEYSKQIAGIQQHFDGQPKHPSHLYTHHGLPYEDVNTYQSMQYNQPPLLQQALHFNQSMPESGTLDNGYTPQNIYQVSTLQHHPQQLPHQQQPRSLSLAQSEGSDGLQQEQFDQADLITLLGDLKMDAGGRAPYLSSKMKNRTAEEPATEDADTYKNALPPMVTGPGMKIRIPPDLLPDDETCMHYFELYFLNVHPYVPVLNKTLFYRQWQNDRDSISPLILEAMFAIGGKLSEEPSQGQQWLALAGKHVDSFMDVPRLSTLQALLIILKAREAAPKKGYYYRSWMTVVQCVAMGKDLGLDEHFEDHKAGRPCGTSPTDCITKTRIWQTIFVCECMIGSPQDRTDMAVEIDTLDLNIPRHVAGEPDTEYHVTRNFIYFTKVVENVRRMNDIYGRIKKKKEWGIDPELTSLNPSFESWLRDLPSDLQIIFSPDTLPPWLPSHSIGNMHSYYYLSIIMLHRPQLQFLDPTAMDGLWKQHMVICYDAAKRLCRIQEAIINAYGMPGLLCMQRGVNFTIYAILTCVVLHLVALTSPDPEISTDARDFFARHMQILEKCTTAWPMPDMQQQIDALREAFSADTRKPFQLKPSFPYGSPSPASHVQSSPPQPLQYHQPHIIRASMESSNLDTQHPQQPQVMYSSHPLTPPISAGTTSKGDSPAAQGLIMMAGGQRAHQPMTSPVPGVNPVWNPSRIFDQWNTNFGPPARPVQPSPPQFLKLDPNGLPDNNLNLSPGSQSQALSAPQYSVPIPTFATPSMWQESVASVYEIGQKRQWGYDDSGMGQQSHKRPR